MPFLYFGTVKRPVWIRAMMALWGVWFAAALTEPAGLMSCPTHSGAASIESNHIPEASGHHASAAMLVHSHGSGHQSVDSPALHTHAAADLDERSTDGDHDSGQHTCSCLGDCCSVAPSQIADRADVFVLPALPLQTVRRSMPAIVLVHTRPAHSLPFAHGPPDDVVA